VHTLTWYRENLEAGPLPATEAAGETVLSLPLGGAHTEQDVDDVLAALRKLHAAFTR
jgi:dTDP-4-amino-4,6-dideoxygalactose transaminase